MKQVAPLPGTKTIVIFKLQFDLEGIKMKASGLLKWVKNRERKNG